MIDDPNTNNTYEVSRLSKEEIVRHHENFQRNYGLELDKDFRKLPPLHWTPKCIRRLLEVD